jgi:cytosine/adenosine deaminase-related metal-dependent hydrolase
MTTLLIKHAEIIVTMDDHRREITDGGLFVRDGFIEQVGKTSELPQEADEILVAHGQVVMPGLINTHHHFYQTLTRAVPEAQDANLFNWLKTLYPIWAGLTPEDIYISTQTALAELALSGCTAASDHLYIFPNGCRLDDEIHAAREIGVRLHASRGSMSLGESKGGLPPDRVVEDEDLIVKDSQRLIEAYHDPNPGAMTQIVLAPCSPFSVTKDLMRISACSRSRLRSMSASTRARAAWSWLEVGIAVVLVLFESSRRAVWPARPRTTRRRPAGRRRCAACWWRRGCPAGCRR